MSTTKVAVSTHPDSASTFTATSTTTHNLSFISGTSDDLRIRLRVDIEDILRLSTTDWQQLYDNPYLFFNSTQTQIISIFKKFTSSSSSNVEEFFHETPPDGYCSVHSLYQLYKRSNSNIELSLSQFIKNFSDMSSNANPDNINIRHIQQQHEQGIKYLDSQYWLGADNYHLYKFPFQFSLWVLSNQDMEYLSLAFTNQLDDNQRLLTSHRLNINQIHALASNANEAHHSNQHFYVVPTQFQLNPNEIQLQIQQAVNNMGDQIKQLLHTLLYNSSPDLIGFSWRLIQL